MTALVGLGVVLTLGGLVGLIWVILAANRARRSGLEGAEMQERLRRLIPVNLGALACSALGLMCVVLGVFL